jgi:hypothetical protein
MECPGLMSSALSGIAWQGQHACRSAATATPASSAATSFGSKARQLFFATPLPQYSGSHAETVEIWRSGCPLSHKQPISEIGRAIESPPSLLVLL